MTIAIPPISRNEPSGEQRPFLERLFGLTLGWFVSSVTHIFALIGLAFLSLPPKLEPIGVRTVSATISPVEEEFVFALSDESGSSGDMALPSETTPSVDLAELLASDVAVELPELASLPAAESMAASALTSLRASADGGQGDSKGIGLGTSLFGVKTIGKRYVYVVDNSNSMTHGRLEAAIQEVQDSVNLLKPNQFFYVIFYSDTAYPLLHPKAAKSYLGATSVNKKKLRSWLSTVEHCLQTKGEEAMELAMSMKPDVIYLMGDGAFSDQTVKQTLGYYDDHVLIHTFGFDMKNDRDKAGFEAIAKKFRGDFHDAKVSPEMFIRERTNKRPRNSTKHGDWGLKLRAPEKAK